MIDWKKLIESSGALIHGADAVRESIIAGINKQLERDLRDTKDALRRAEEAKGKCQQELRECTEKLEAAQREVARLKLLAAEQRVEEVGDK